MVGLYPDRDPDPDPDRDRYFCFRLRMASLHNREGLNGAHLHIERIGEWLSVLP